MINLILAMDARGGIGLNGQLPWRIAGDLHLFRIHTIGHVVVMGRKTWESLPKKPLDGRINIVLSSRFKPQGVVERDGALWMSDVATVYAHTRGREVFVIGGAQVYDQFTVLAERLYISHVHGIHEVDTQVHIDFRRWKPVTHKTFDTFTFAIYERK